MSELQKLESFRYSLAVAETFEEIKLIGSAAAGMAELARKEKISLEKQNEIGKFRIEVMEKVGQWLDEHYPSKHASNHYLLGNTREPSKMPVSKRESVNNRTVAKTNPDIKEQIFKKIESRGDVITPNRVANEIKKREREEKIKTQKQNIEKGVDQPKDKYSVIVIDPPWNYGRGYDPEGSRVANPYPEMSQEELMRFQLPSKDNCVLWLWTTHAFIWDAKDLMDNWGFAYKAILVWDKEKMGMGYWLRMQAEFCLMGIKGNVILNNQFTRDIIREPRGNHSKKPEGFYIYGQWLHLLGDGMIIKDVIVWPLDKMKEIRKLKEHEIIQLNQFTTKNYNYDSTKKYWYDNE